MFVRIPAVRRRLPRPGLARVAEQSVGTVSIVRAIAAVLSLLLLAANTAHAKGLYELLRSHQVASKECRVPPLASASLTVLPEIFPEVIHKTPGGDLGSRQLFEPIRRIGEPLATLGAECSAGRGESCERFKTWVQQLVSNDSLRFDKERHRSSRVSLVTGTLSGNLAIRPIAFYAGALQEAGLIEFDDEAAVYEWLSRRALEYDIIPARLSAKSAQNLVLASALTKLVVESVADKASAALTDASRVYRLYLDNSRADGSFPEETRRGVSALKYMNMAVAELVMLAELAHYRGVELYDYRAGNGVSIHTAVAFVANAILDESTIAEYAKENFAPTDRAQSGVAMGFLQTNFSWVSVYMRRFPNAATTSNLRSLLASRKIPSSGFYDEVLGLVARCGK